MPKFSLATLLIAATTAAVLTWLNVKPTQTSHEQTYAPVKGAGGGLSKLATAVHTDRGWPVAAMRTTTYTDIPSPFDDDGSRIEMGNLAYVVNGEAIPLEFDERPTISRARAVFDFTLAITLLLLTMIIFEFLLRRSRSVCLEARPS